MRTPNVNQTLEMRSFEDSGICPFILGGNGYYSRELYMSQGLEEWLRLEIGVDSQPCSAVG